MNTKNIETERPEWAKAATITRLLGPSRSSLYEAAAKGIIRTASVKGRGKIRGSRFFSYDSVKKWIEASATGGNEIEVNEEALIAAGWTPPATSPENDEAIHGGDGSPNSN